MGSAPAAWEGELSATGAGGQTERLVAPPPDNRLNSRADIHGDKARTALAGSDQQQHALAATLLRFGYAGLHVGGRMHGMAADPLDDVAGLQAFVCGVAVGIDFG